jgi:hypothetical protein
MKTYWGTLGGKHDVGFVNENCFHPFFKLAVVDVHTRHGGSCSRLLLSGFHWFPKSSDDSLKFDESALLDPSGGAHRPTLTTADLLGGSCTDHMAISHHRYAGFGIRGRH